MKTQISIPEDFKFSFRFFTVKAGQALSLARSIAKAKNGLMALGKALEQAWKEIKQATYEQLVTLELEAKKVKALACGVISFVKVDGSGEVHTRQIIPINELTGFRDFDADYFGLFKFIDAEVYAKTKDAKMSIRSCYLQNVIG